MAMLQEYYNKWFGIPPLVPSNANQSASKNHNFLGLVVREMKPALTQNNQTESAGTNLVAES
jgi:hypothetical protein